MDNKKSPTRRLNKRQSKVLENIYWDCSVCTYKNTPEAFKCQMCDVRKGTSTRKPRLNPVIAALQSATLPSGSIVPNGVSQPKPSKTLRNRYGSTTRSARLRNVDRSTAQTREVTVNSVTVVITEYKPIMITSSPEASENSCGESSDSRN